MTRFGVVAAGMVGVDMHAMRHGSVGERKSAGWKRDLRHCRGKEIEVSTHFWLAFYASQ